MGWSVATEARRSGAARTVCALLLSLAAIAPALAQPASSTYDYPAQISALDALRADLPEAERGLANIVDLSRLLSSPCDQARWMLAQLPAAGARVAANERAALEAVQARVDVLRDAAGLTDDACPPLAALGERVGALLAPRAGGALWTLTDPAALAEAWAQRSDDALSGATPAQLALLGARGVPLAALPDTPALEPLRAVAALAGGSELPPAWECVDVRDALAAARSQLAPLDDDALDSAFQIADAYVRLALHLAPEPDSAARFQALADASRAADAWLWAALADALAASRGAATAASAQAALTRFATTARALDADGATATLANSLAASLDRAAQQDLGSLAQLPLAPDLAQRRANLRRQYEQAFLAARGRNDSDAALRAIQQAKAAAVHPAFAGRTPVITLAALEQALLTRGSIERTLANAYVEVLQMETDGNYYAVVLTAANADLSGSSYTSSFHGPAADPAALVRSALPDYWRGRSDFQVIIAPDGAVGPVWFALDRELAGVMTERNSGWGYYVPTAAALQSGAWSRDALLRWQIQLAERARQPWPEFVEARRGPGLAEMRSFKQGTPTGLSGVILHGPADERTLRSASLNATDYSRYLQMKLSSREPLPHLVFVTMP